MLFIVVPRYGYETVVFQLYGVSIEITPVDERHSSSGYVNPTARSVEMKSFGVVPHKLVLVGVILVILLCVVKLTDINSLHNTIKMNISI